MLESLCVYGTRVLAHRLSSLSILGRFYDCNVMYPSCFQMYRLGRRGVKKGLASL
jgi:hypothetical protein